LNALQHKQLFQSALLCWYREHGRDLPWRRTSDPYAIFVSEFMLQQTQVAGVLPFYYNWLQRFPDFNTLARASENDVLHAWQGLGYYARARNLHAAAKIVAAKYRGKCPRDINELQSLPGIARYTANAIATFAFDQAVAVVDANIARLIARLCNIVLPIDSAAGQTAVWNSAAQLVHDRHAGRFNSALMDLGATICLPRAPKCGICPVKKFCRAKNPAALPVRRARPKSKRLVECHSFAVRRRKILLEQSTRRWRGMWILPPLRTHSLSGFPIHTSIFSFTHHRVKLAVWPIVCARTKHRRWFSVGEIESIPMPSPHRRAVLDLLGKANSLAVERHGRAAVRS
jgi:A/G-specific adenine glycosylase